MESCSELPTKIYDYRTYNFITLVSMLIKGNSVSNYTSQNILTRAQTLSRTKPQASISENIFKRYHSQKCCYLYIVIDLSLL